jgi:hypothetical protein
LVACWGESEEEARGDLSPMSLSISTTPLSVCLPLSPLAVGEFDSIGS